jgi:hypothetical protein
MFMIAFVTVISRVVFYITPHPSTLSQQHALFFLLNFRLVSLHFNFSNFPNDVFWLTPEARPFARLVYLVHVIIRLHLSKRAGESRRSSRAD